MHVTVRVRINWPIPAVRLFDAVTATVGGDPLTVRRTEAHPCDIYGMHRISNEPDQGLTALAQVLWTEQPDVGWPDEPEPPALVILTASTPGVLELPRWVDLRQLHDSNVLPVARDWLDAHGVPRTSWWWSCEDLGYFPGTIDVTALAHSADLHAIAPEATLDTTSHRVTRTGLPSPRFPHIWSGILAQSSSESSVSHQESEVWGPR